MNYTKLNKVQGRWHYNHSNSHTVTPSKPTPSSNPQPNQNPEPNHTSLTGLLPPSSEKVSTVVGHPPTHRQRRSYQMSRQRAAAEARHIHTHPSIHTKQRRLEVHRETHMMRREKGGLATVPPATLLYKTFRRRVRSCELGDWAVQRSDWCVVRDALVSKVGWCHRRELLLPSGLVWSGRSGDRMWESIRSCAWTGSLRGHTKTGRYQI